MAADAKLLESLNGVLMLVSAAILAATLLAATLMFGGTSPAALYTMRLLILSAFAVQLVMFASGEKAGGLKKEMTAALGFFGAFLVFGALQYAMGKAVIAHPLPGTVVRYATFQNVIQLVFYAIFFVSATNVLRSRFVSQKFALFIVFLLFGVTLFGMIQELSGTNKIYWTFDVGSSSFFGPFVYENNFGAFTALTFPLLLAVIGYRAFKILEEWKANDSKFSTELVIYLGRAGIPGLLFIAVLTLAGVFYSQARASAFIMFFCMAALVFFLRRNRFVLTLLVAGAVIFVLFMVMMDFSKLIQNYNVSEAVRTELGQRFAVICDTWRMFAARPLFGWGLGGFPFVYARYLSIPLEDVQFQHPNNDFVELLSESGLVGAFLCIASIGILVYFGLKAIPKTRSVWSRALGWQGLLSLTGLAMMVLFDSHLKVPSIALFFVFQLAIFFSQFGFRPEHAASAETAAPLSGRFSRNFFIRCGWIAAGVAVGIGMFHYARVDYKTKVLSRSSENLTSADPFLMEHEKTNPTFWFKKSTAHYEEYAKAKTAPEKAKLLEEAVQAIARAVSLAPTHPHYRFVYAQLLYAQGKKSEGIQALEETLAWAPTNRLYGSYLLSVYLAEKKHVMSPSRKMEYENKARALLARMSAWKHPITQDQLRAWMFNFDATEIEGLLSGMTLQDRR